jgi:hypothetical protein
MQLNLRKCKYVVYQENVPVFYATNEALAASVARERWVYSPEDNVDRQGMICGLPRGRRVPHSVYYPDGKYVHVEDLFFVDNKFARVIKHSETPAMGKPEPPPHWAVM